MAEVEERMEKIGVDTDMREALLDVLKQQNFVDDERYCRGFVRGKFRIQQWGKIKIRAELKLKRMPESSISAALKSEIDPEEYEITARKLALKKWKSLKDAAPARRQKVLRFLLQKGFEHEVCRKVMPGKE